ncbi:methyl coenzyme M reductase-arginine methyltransferase Mmp10 [Methanothermobacter sp.]|uniref:methyl coenzyme M reductase-arginine methyltransferase Mmp10 n=1 Tax=Methanothermobacter sp. TaxID=1884223 RepID=UPI0026209899|nr:methyl coenzyme M reductase-arginine methyltransferase Mmp10 [Methanothermobacter sp.]MDI9614902.1 methyl coenzyme M reductase-arginine methyltransferase Mmp10 [Methanothermobacter sp.]
MQIIADLGGIPGKDCRGFCRYCYFRKVGEFEPFGCRNCSPGRVGCETCGTDVAERGKEFLPPFLVMGNVQTTLMMQNTQDKDLKINISGGGDVSCYPHLEELTSGLSEFGIPIHLGYTSGKGMDDPELASRLIGNGVDEVTFTVFSANPLLRREWMRDRNAENALEALRIFCESCEVHAAAVIIPGVNDGDDLLETCSRLEEWGATGFIMMRFANYEHQGLILGNEPIIEGIEPHTVQEFEDLVRMVDREFNLRVTGTPVCDPENGTPFVLADDSSREYLEILPEIRGEATIITGSIAAPYIRRIIRNLGAEDMVNVVGVEKDIACLITRRDLEAVDLSELKETVIIPGRAFVHEMQAKEVLSRDGTDRIVIRGPERLTVDGEMSGTLSQYDVIEREMEAFYELIQAINFFGASE